ncbi:hypothetical protein DFJ58DRAFT_725781 [Suillus subalutaceus]|uniref:uncharacterized protein n=1 Tax=Suillus subalutaceus TaxID=48586 RepID=UPI001B8649D2|nr:uncharacterized protein DFJ58DRAFT_725781 [Suillus subalutaceus]KAG1861613.1 hypothetical protein DFJ58DRAFT_725781 [Suillus subalutaceus]
MTVTKLPSQLCCSPWMLPLATGSNAPSSITSVKINIPNNNANNTTNVINFHSPNNNTNTTTNSITHSNVQRQNFHLPAGSQPRCRFLRAYSSMWEAGSSTHQTAAGTQLPPPSPYTTGAWPIPPFPHLLQPNPCLLQPTPQLPPPNP